MVWKYTKLAGFGMAKSVNGNKVYVVGQYKPPGNFMGKWEANVPRPLNGLINVPTPEELSKCLRIRLLIISSRH